jgi:Amt family ammonium transporter
MTAYFLLFFPKFKKRTNKFLADTIIVFAVSLIDKLKLEDATDTIELYLTCGIRGTLAIGLFANPAEID